jgi:hypothetical protein
MVVACAVDAPAQLALSSMVLQSCRRRGRRSDYGKWCAPRANLDFLEARPWTEK